MPRALITGIDGFTGRYLASELEENGYQVFGTCRHGDESRGNVFPVDLLDKERLHAIVEKVSPDVVAHLAAVAFVAHDDKDSIYRVNILGTRNLLECLGKLTAAPSAVLLASSANVYGNVDGIAIDETFPMNPVNDYAVSKVAMEYVARLWMDRLPIVVTRPFNYTGVGQSGVFLLPKIVAHFLRQEEVIELGNLEVSRDFTDVRDVVRAYGQLLSFCPSGEAVNICTGVSHSLLEVVSMVREITSQDIRIAVNPDFVRENELRVLKGNPDKLRAVVGDWRPIELAETLRWMLSAESGYGNPAPSEA